MEQRALAVFHRERTGRGLASALVLWTCATVIMHVSADITTAAILTAPGTLTPQTSKSGENSLPTTIPGPKSSTAASPSPANLGTTVSVPPVTNFTKPTTDSPATRLTTTKGIATDIETLSTTSNLATTIGSSKALTSPPNATTNSTGLKTVTPADYVIRNPTPGTTRVPTQQQGNQTTGPDAGNTSGSASDMTTAPPTVTSGNLDTSVVVVVVATTDKTTDEQNATDYVTPNVNTTFGAGLDPDREKDELQKLLLIIGGSIGGAVVAILVTFAIVYRIAKRRKQKANSRYYNFKKKKSNYEKVLHLQEYYGEPEPDNSTTGTGAAWVFQENDGEANKTITLELDSKDKEKPGRRHKNRNKNKNNRNKSGVGRGNYQVLAEMFPTRNIPPDVLLPADGAVPSNSEEEEGAILDTCLGASLAAPSREDRSEVGSATASDRLSSQGSFKSGGKPSWPAWNNRGNVTIRPEDDTVVEL